MDGGRKKMSGLRKEEMNGWRKEEDEWIEEGTK
jgi:hypothetical protein